MVANTHDVKANARWLDMHLHAHPIYRSSIVDALLEDPAAIVRLHTHVKGPQPPSLLPFARLLPF